MKDQTRAPLYEALEKGLKHCDRCDPPELIDLMEASE